MKRSLSPSMPWLSFFLESHAAGAHVHGLGDEPHAETGV